MIQASLFLFTRTRGGTFFNENCLHITTRPPPDRMDTEIANLLGLKVTLWKIIGWTGAFLFTARWIVQMVVSRREGKPTFPASYWWLSVAGNLMVLSYFIFSAQQSSVGVLQNLFPSFVASYNLYLDLTHRRRNLQNPPDSPA